MNYKGFTIKTLKVSLGGGAFISEAQRESDGAFCGTIAVTGKGAMRRSVVIVMKKIDELTEEKPNAHDDPTFNTPNRRSVKPTH